MEWLCKKVNICTDCNLSQTQLEVSEHNMYVSSLKITKKIIILDLTALIILQLYYNNE
jgi:hypothetical protein